VANFTFPGDRNEMRKAIEELQGAANAISGQMNLLLAFTTRSPEAKKEWWHFVDNVANAELSPENAEMQQMARFLMSMMRSTPTDDNTTPPPGGGPKTPNSSFGKSHNVIQFPTFKSSK